MSLFLWSLTFWWGQGYHSRAVAEGLPCGVIRSRTGESQNRTPKPWG